MGSCDRYEIVTRHAGRSSTATRILLALLAATAGTAAIPTAHAAWTTQTVLDKHGQGAGTDLAVQPTGQVHISGQGADARALVHATNAYGATPWSIDQIETVPDGATGQTSSIAVDSNGDTHVCFYDQFHHVVTYATNDSGTWTTRQIEGNGAGMYSAIATDSANRAHILTASGSGELHYATNSIGAADNWTGATLPGNSSAHYLRIAVDAGAHAHALYTSGADLRYATNASGAWVGSLVQANVYPNFPLALHIDSAGHAHAAYLDNTPPVTMRYATNAADGAHWILESLETLASPAQIVPSITTDAAGTATVDYFDQASRLLKRAVKGSGGTWQSLLQYTLAETASDASLATDAAGNVHLVYTNPNAQDPSLGSLKHLTNAPDPVGADVQVTQTRAPDQILVGRTVTYTVTITNLGANGASGVTLIDTLPTGSVFVAATGGAVFDAAGGVVRWDIGNLAKNASVSTIISLQAPAAAGTMTNKVSVSSSGGLDFRKANDTVSISDPVTLPTHPLQLAVLGSTGGTLEALDTQDQYAEGATVTVTATPDPGYRIKAWQGTLNDTSTATTNTVLIGTADKTVVQVQFEKIPRQLTATVVGGHGSLSPTGGQYPDGTFVRLAATPEPHYRVKQWTGTDNDVGMTDNNGVTMDKDCFVTVEFEPAGNHAPYAIASVPSTVFQGDTVTLDASASEDPDGDAITYSWTVTSDVALSDPKAVQTTFVAPTGLDQELMLEAVLTVSDGELIADSYHVIKVKPPIPGGPCARGVGAGNLLTFAGLCFAGLAGMKWGPRRRRPAR